MGAMENPINEMESLWRLQKEIQCGKVFFKASKEKKTVHKAKLLTYPHMNGQLIIDRLKECDEFTSQVTYKE